MCALVREARRNLRSGLQRTRRPEPWWLETPPSSPGRLGDAGWSSTAQDLCPLPDRAPERYPRAGKSAGRVGNGYMDSSRRNGASPGAREFIHRGSREVGGDDGLRLEGLVSHRLEWRRGVTAWNCVCDPPRRSGLIRQAQVEVGDVLALARADLIAPHICLKRRDQTG